MDLAPALLALALLLPTTSATLPPKTWPAVPDDVAGRPALTLVPDVLETRDGRRAEVERGVLRVPACHDTDDGVVELAFVRFPSTAAAPGPPIVYLAGGPGTSGIQTARGPRHDVFQQLRAVADVIALDQRGVGDSRPRLVCDHTWELPLDRPLDLEQSVAVQSERVAACREHYAADGVDLGCYDTAHSVRDLEALRRALGAETVSLWGISYGTHLALAYVRAHPERVARAVLAGVEGPQHTLKLPSQVQANLERLAARVAADPELAPRIPDLLGLVESVLTRLEQRPVTIAVGDEQIVVGRSDVALLTAQAMGNQDALSKLPAFYLAMDAGHFEPLGPYALARRRGTTGSAMRWAMDCASGVSPERRARIAREAPDTLLGDLIDFPLPALCDAWGVDDLGDAFRAPVRADVPVLWISGTLDGRTPPSNAEEVAAGFARGARLVIDGAAHSDPLFLSSPRIAEVMSAFLAGEDVDSERIELPPPSFLAPPEGPP